jgi:hypothetical protein
VVKSTTRSSTSPDQRDACSAVLNFRASGPSTPSMISASPSKPNISAHSCDTAATIARNATPAPSAVKT